MLKPFGNVIQDHAIGESNCCFLKSSIPALDSGKYYAPSGQTSVVYALKPRITCTCGLPDEWDGTLGQTAVVSGIVADYPYGCTLMDYRTGAPYASYGSCLGRSGCNRCY